MDTIYQIIESCPKNEYKTEVKTKVFNSLVDLLSEIFKDTDYMIEEVLNLIAVDYKDKMKSYISSQGYLAKDQLSTLDKIKYDNSLYIRYETKSLFNGELCNLFSQDALKDTYYVENNRPVVYREVNIDSLKNVDSCIWSQLQSLIKKADKNKELKAAKKAKAAASKEKKELLKAQAVLAKYNNGSTLTKKVKKK